jgi:hypothetical protein
LRTLWRIAFTDGAPILLQATVSLTADATDGSITYLDAGAPLGEKPLLTGRGATLQLLSLGIGLHDLTARFDDASGAPISTSNHVQQIVTGDQRLQIVASAAGRSQSVSIPVSLR